MAEQEATHHNNDSVQQAEESTQRTTTDREDRERQIRELHQDESVCQEGSTATQIATINSEDREIQIREPLQEKESCNQQIQDLQQNLLNKEKMIQELQEENQHLHQELDKVLQQLKVTQKEKLALSWKMCEAVPNTMLRGSATVCDSMAYFRPALSRQVHTYNSETQEWSTLPECPQNYFALTTVNDLVTAVGGEHSGNCTNTLLSLVEEDGENKWVEHFPPMPTKRALTATMSTGKVLVVAGGYGEEYTTLATVEVMETDTLQWSTASSLPHPLSDATATVCRDRVYLGGGWDEHGYSTKSTFTCSLSALLTIGAKMKALSLNGNHPAWQMIADLPVKCSTFVTLKGQLLAVGGEDSDETNNTIYSYNRETNSWEVISHMPTLRCWCLVAVLPGHKLMVVGGENSTGYTDEVEIAAVDSMHVN